MTTDVKVHVKRAQTFTVPCPHCGHATERPTPAAGAPFENPFSFTCRCGRELRVQMNFRRTIRRKVQLTGAVAFAPRNVTEVCTVEGLSLTGLSLSVYSPSAATVGAQAVVKFTLNDPRSSRLSLAGTVRRVTKAGARLEVGIEFGRLPDYESQALSFYVM